MDVSIRQIERERYSELVENRHWLKARIAAHRLGLSRREFRAHWRGLTPDQVDDRLGDLPPFDDFAALGPDVFDLRVLDQTEVWVDILRVPHVISDREDFGDRYLLNVVAMLRGDAVRRITLADDEGVSDASGFDAHVQAMEATPLFRALLAEAERRGIEVPS